MKYRNEYRRKGGREKEREREGGRERKRGYLISED